MQNRHPLDPLTRDEIQLTHHLLKTLQSLQDYHRFVYVMNEEPDQATILNFKQDTQLDRIAFVCVLDSKHNETFEARVNLTTQSIIEWKKLPFDQYPYGQAPVLPEEAVKCAQIVKANPAWRDAMKKRNLTDEEIDLLQVDSFSIGYNDREDERGKRIVYASAYYRKKFTDNAYAHPIDGLIAAVDLTKSEIIRLEDDGKNTPIPKAENNYDLASVKEICPPLKPLEITQPEGPDFKVDGWQVSWLNWKFRIGFTQREGLVLHTVSFQDKGHDRSIMHRASITEMAVPYADPSMSHFFKCAFDAGENGFGRFANELKLGCDCKGHIQYLDVPTANESGEPILLKNAICLHEVDAGPIGKHNEHRTGVDETRRSREFVVSWSTSIDNYTYIFYWHFALDGSMWLEIRLTGIVLTTALIPGEGYEWGGKLTPELAAPMHQHIFGFRLHMSVDGPNNVVSESEFGSKPISAINPRGMAFGRHKVDLQTEAEGARFANAATERSWTISNPSVFNAIGQPTAYKIEIPQTQLLLADKASTTYQRATFGMQHLWVSKYDPAQKYSAGDYPNQHAGGDGLPHYLKTNRSIYNTPTVLWPVYGVTHYPRTEDFVMMPTKVVVPFHLIPSGFFDKSPVTSLAPETMQQNGVSPEKLHSCCDTPNPHQLFSPSNLGSPKTDDEKVETSLTT